MIFVECDRSPDFLCCITQPWATDFNSPGPGQSLGWVREEFPGEIWKPGAMWGSELVTESRLLHSWSEERPHTIVWWLQMSGWSHDISRAEVSAAGAAMDCQRWQGGDRGSDLPLKIWIHSQECGDRGTGHWGQHQGIYQGDRLP